MTSISPFKRIVVLNRTTGVEFNATLFTENCRGQLLVCPDYREELIWIDRVNYRIQLRLI